MSRRGWTTTRRASLWACLGALCAPAMAVAGTATSEGGTARYADATGAADDLSVTLELIARTPDVDPQGWNVLFYSLADAVTWGAGCQEGFVGTICPYGPNPPGAVAVDLGAGDDKLELGVRLEARAAPTRITLSGGPGDDAISAVGARAEIDGGEGDDLIEPDERFALDTPPEPTPGGVIRGGPGTDTAGYEETLDPIAVSLDGAANDGRSGEGDNVQPDVENVTGSHYGNTLLGSAVANTLIGGGDDDRIAGGRGRDSLDGRGGNDTLDALDAAGGDRIACSDGADVAFADAGDVVAVEQTVGGAVCEQVSWAPRLRGSKLRVRNGRIAFRLSCPKAATRCRGSVILRARKTLARASYRLRRGRSATVRARPARALKRGTVKATALVQPAGARAIAGRAVTIRR